MPVQEDKSIIKEIITHLNSLEEKIKTLNDNVDETEDLVTVNKLDIVNLKNSLERIKISMPEVSPDTLSKLRNVEKITENMKKMESLDRIEKDIEVLKSQKGATKEKGLNDVVAGLEFMNQKIEKLESKMNEMSHEGHEEHRNEIGKIHERVQTIEDKTSMIKHCPKCHAFLNEKAAFCNKCGYKVE
jgi:chromosome segregation ATPase